MAYRKILLVADRTAAGQEVITALRVRLAEPPTQVTLLVPATPSHRGWTWEEEDARGTAEHRMATSVSKLKHAGIAVDGVLGGFSPMQAVRQELEHHRYDEILISTLPARVSRWLRQDLPARVAREFDVPVTHLEAGERSRDLVTRSSRTNVPTSASRFRDRVGTTSR